MSIYKIVNSVNDFVYVGSTTETLEIRFTKHKSDCRKRSKNQLLYLEMLDIGIKNFSIELIEKVDDLEKLKERETYWIIKLDTINNGYNMKKATHDRKEYYHENKEYFSDLHKKYYENHKDEITKYREEYYVKNKDKINKYIETNKEHIAERSKIYRETNKDKINEYKSEKHICECGSPYRNDGKSKHLKTLKHQDFIKNKI